MGVGGQMPRASLQKHATLYFSIFTIPMTYVFRPILGIWNGIDIESKKKV